MGKGERRRVARHCADGLRPRRRPHARALRRLPDAHRQTCRAGRVGDRSQKLDRARLAIEGKDWESVMEAVFSFQFSVFSFEVPGSRFHWEGLAYGGLQMRVRDGCGTVQEIAPFSRKRNRKLI